MLPPSKWRLYLLVLVLLFEVPHLSAVIGYGRVFHGQHIQCFHGGAWVGLIRLGVYSRARRYDQVFTGTVQSVAEISFTERQLEIVRDEVFLGDVADKVTAVINQACVEEGLPEIKVGDKWVFYVRERPPYYTGEPPRFMPESLVVVYDSPVKPVADADYDICLLRHHSDIEEDCIALMPKHPTQNEFYVCKSRGPLDGIADPLASSAEPRSELPFELDLSRVKAPQEFRVIDPKPDTATIFVARDQMWSASGCSAYFAPF